MFQNGHYQFSLKKSLFAKKDLWGAVIWKQMQDLWHQTLYFIWLYISVIWTCMDRVKYFEVSERSISTNCKVNSDIQTVNYPQNTKYRLTQQIKHIFGSEWRRKALLVWIMVKMSQEECLTCHVYLLSTLDSRAFNQPSSSLSLPEFAAWHDHSNQAQYILF